MSDSAPSPASEAKSQAPASQKRRPVWFAAKVLGTVAGLAYVFATVDVDSVMSSLASVEVTSIVIVVALTVLGVFVAAVRWRIVLASYGCIALPTHLRLVHLYLVGLFYNSFLPGGVGGDVVRGIVSREAFGRGGTTAALTVVAIERALGLCGVLVLSAATLVFRPLPGVTNVLPWSLAGLALAFTAIAMVSGARRLEPSLPLPLARLVANIPPLVRPSGLLAGLGLSLATQALVALAGHAVLTDVAPSVRLSDSLAIVPVAAAAAFFPLSVGGAGAREAAFVLLCGAALHLDRSDALAASLALWSGQLLVAGIGGVVQLVSPPRGVEP